MVLPAPEHTRIPQPFGGWALQKAAVLDQTSSRGLVADVASLPMLKRQGVFAALASIDPADPTPYLSRLGTPDLSFGDAIRVSPARNIVAAAFGVDRVPTGYLRALTRIGFKPLDEPHLYRRLFDIFAHEPRGSKAHALRYCGPVTTTTVQVVDVLDPILITAEIVSAMRGPRQAQKANGIIRFIRSVCSSLTDEDLAAGLRQAMAHSGIEQFAQRMIQKADRFPPPPLPFNLDFIPITSAPEMIRLGREMRNCLASRTPHALLGLAAYYQTEVPIGGRALPVVVELAPLSNGTWAVEGVFLRGNQRPPRAVMASLVRRLIELGAVVAMNPRLHQKARDLVAPLGVYAYGEFQLLALENDEEDETLVHPDEAMLDVVFRDIEQGMMA